MDIRVELLTGSIKGKRREAILAGLLTGDVQILIGTHAVIEDTVNFSSLGFVVIDEQHRFGVAQRARLWSKNVQPPHVLVMTATPIPRTLAMTLYGDLTCLLSMNFRPEENRLLPSINSTIAGKACIVRCVSRSTKDARFILSIR